MMRCRWRQLVAQTVQPIKEPAPFLFALPRSYNYLPFKPGTGKGGFRQDCAKWPGGGARDFLDRVAYEILPMLQERYNIAQVATYFICLTFCLRPSIAICQAEERYYTTWY